MKVLAIFIVTLVGFASADSSWSGSGSNKAADYYDGNKHVTYSCDISGTEATCIQNVTDGYISAAKCQSSNWGTGNGKAKKGQCCNTNDDCKDTCNGAICGKAW